MRVNFETSAAASYKKIIHKNLLLRRNVKNGLNEKHCKKSRVRDSSLRMQNMTDINCDFTNRVKGYQ